MPTKFDLPSVRPEHLLRARQLALVDPHARLVLVCAPAGYGKTTLLAQWIARDRARAAAWVALAPADDSPVAFWTAVVTGLAGACPSVGRRSLAALAGPLHDLEATVLAPLLEDLCERAGGVDLVLDDLHVVEDPACHDGLAWLVEHMPAHVRVAIATRHAPRLPLGRLRVHGRLTELCAADLRFDAGEAHELLNEQFGLQLDNADVDALARRTEGWPAGLYLAALSLRAAEDRSACVAAFAGDDELIADFLGPELLCGLDAQTRTFLARTSILDSFCAPLCDAVVGGGERSAAEILAELGRTNLFLVSLDRRRRWFRYGRLFGELLRAELEYDEPELVPELHRRAATWHDANGRTVDAIRHDLAAGDVESAALRISASWRTLYNSPDWPQAAAWLAELPEAQLAHVPGFAVTKARIAAILGAPDEVRRLTAIARQHDDGGALPDGSSSTEAALALIAAVFPFGDSGRARAAALRAAELEPGDVHAAHVAFALGCTGFWSGAGEPEVRRALQSAIRLGGDRSIDATAVSAALAYLAYLDLFAGDVGRARGHVARARRLADRYGIGEHPAASVIRIASGWLLLADGEHAAAELELERALELARACGEPLHVAGALRLLAECREAAGDRQAAADGLLQARVIVELRCPDPGLLRRLVDATAARLGVGPRALPMRGVDGAEPLSERELDVLRLLAGTLSLPGIAAELFVAHNTIKTHCRTIYRKLGARGRGEAVQRARALGLAAV